MQGCLIVVTLLFRLEKLPGFAVNPDVLFIRCCEQRLCVAKPISIVAEYMKDKPPITSKPTHKNTYNQNTFTVRRLPIFRPPKVNPPALAKKLSEPILAPTMIAEISVIAYLMFRGVRANLSAG